MHRLPCTTVDVQLPRDYPTHISYINTYIFQKEHNIEYRRVVSYNFDRIAYVLNVIENYENYLKKKKTRRYLRIVSR